MTFGDAASRMALLRDEELILIAFSGNEEGYEEVVINSAKKELKNRGISVENDINNIESNKYREFIEEIKINKAHEFLGPIQELLFFVFSSFFMTWVVAFIIKQKGYDRKFRDACRAIAYGLGLQLFFGFCYLIFVLIRT